MLLSVAEKSKNNEIMLAFIEKLVLSVMTKTREICGGDGTLLPNPKTIEEVNTINALTKNVVKQILKNETNLLSLAEDKQIDFLPGSPLARINLNELITNNVENSGITDIVADKVLFDIRFVKDVVKPLMEETTNNIIREKTIYEMNKQKMSLSVIGVDIPSIIEYYYNKNELAETVNENLITESISIDFNELTEDKLIVLLREFYNYNSTEIESFISTFSNGEMIAMFKTYFGNINSNNEELMLLNVSPMNKSKETFFVYLMSKALLELKPFNYFPNNEEKYNVVLRNLILISGRNCRKYIEKIKAYTEAKTLVVYKTDRSVFVISDVLAIEEIDMKAIIGSCIDRNDGVVLYSLENIKLEQTDFIGKYESYKNTLQTKIGLEMLENIKTIYFIECKKQIDKIKEDNILTDDRNAYAINSEIAVILEKRKEEIYEVFSTVKDIFTDIVFKDTNTGLFLTYWKTFHMINNNLNPTDLALLSGAALTAKYIATQVYVKE